MVLRLVVSCACAQNVRPVRKDPKIKSFFISIDRIIVLVY
jgi:hypothetical protein